VIGVTSLHVYPVKSCRGIALDRAEVTATGFRWDRRWMVVDSDGGFLSQRTHPALATVSTRLEDDRLILSAPSQPVLEVSLAEPAEGTLPVTIWDDPATAAGEGEAAAAWFSSLLATPCALVRQQQDTPRPVDPRYAGPDDVVGFADGYPFLLISQSSVDDLNDRLPTPVSADRFRANIVVDGCPAYAEDEWTVLRIGSVPFRVAKPCARCSIVGTDQRDGSRDREPLATLAEYRSVGNKVLFGQNLVHQAGGVVAVGDTVTIVEET